jgi:hypothetical protein
VSWVSVLAGFLVAHMVGDYLFQTDWQALNKRGGLTAGGVSRKALVAHVTTYTLAFLPAFIWIGSELDAVWAIVAAVLVYVPHLIIDDGRLVALYIARVKRVEALTLGLAASVDQSFHVLSLFLAAVVIGAA